MRDFSNERLTAQGIWIAGDDFAFKVCSDLPIAADRALAAQLSARWNACVKALALLDKISASNEVLDARIILREAILGKR